MIEAPPPTSEPSPTTTPWHDPPLDHRGAQRAGVEVHEALVHDRGAGGQVGAEPDPVGVGDPHARTARRSRSSGGTCPPRTRPGAGRRRARSGAARRPGPAGTARPRSRPRWPAGRRCRRGWPGGAGPGGGRAGAAAGTRRTRPWAGRPASRSRRRTSAVRRPGSARGPAAVEPAPRSAAGRGGCAQAELARPGYQVSSTWPVGGDGGEADAPGGLSRASWQSRYDR